MYGTHFFKKDIKREWYWELLLVSIGLFLLSCFKNMPILRSVKVRIEVITRKLRQKEIVLVLKHYFVMLQVCIFHTEVKKSIVGSIIWYSLEATSLDDNCVAFFFIETELY